MNTTEKTDLKKRLEKFANLPSIPEIVFRIKEVAEDPNASPADLANCILSDHQLTGRILRMANSSYYGSFAGKINTVTHAIVLMGFRAVHNIAISMAIYEAANNFSKNCKFDMTSFWPRSLAGGVISKYLVSKINQPKLIELAFIAGFLHDIGQAILAGAFPDKYDQIFKLSSDDSSICKSEKVILGIDHTEAGLCIAQQWNLPTNLTWAITEHHRLNKAGTCRSQEILVRLAYLADRFYPLVMAAAPDETGTYHDVFAEAQKLIGISDDSMTDLLADCREQITDIASDLKINIDREFDYGQEPTEEVINMRDQLNAQEVQLAFLRNAGMGLTSAKSNDEVLQIACEAIFTGLQLGRVIIFEFNARKKQFEGRVGFGLVSQQAVQALHFSSEQGLFEYLRNNGNSVSAAENGLEVNLSDDEANRLGARAFAAVPIKVLDVVSFVIFADRIDRSKPLDDSIADTIASLSTQAGLVLERNMLKAKLLGQ